MAKIEGFRELSQQLSKMQAAAGGQILRRAAMQGTLPALRAAQAAAPIGTPPYESRGGDGDPYPTRTYKGNLKVPGFLKRNIRRKSWLSTDKRLVKVSIGPSDEAFYGTQFIELGTSKIPKRPWLEPSFRASRGAVDKRFRDRLKKLIAKAAK